VSKHYPLLKNYVLDVGRDLLARGKVRRKFFGQPVEDLVREESQVVLSEVAGDIRTLVTELGISMVAGGTMILESFLRKQVDDAVGAGRGAIFEILAGAFRQPR